MAILVQASDEPRSAAGPCRWLRSCLLIPTTRALPGSAGFLPLALAGMIAEVRRRFLTITGPPSWSAWLSSAWSLVSLGPGCCSSGLVAASYSYSMLGPSGCSSQLPTQHGRTRRRPRRGRNHPLGVIAVSWYRNPYPEWGGLPQAASAMGSSGPYLPPGAGASLMSDRVLRWSRRHDAAVSLTWVRRHWPGTGTCGPSKYAVSPAPSLDPDDTVVRRHVRDGSAQRVGDSSFSLDCTGCSSLSSPIGGCRQTALRCGWGSEQPMSNQWGVYKKITPPGAV